MVPVKMDESQDTPHFGATCLNNLQAAPTVRRAIESGLQLVP